MISALLLLAAVQDPFPLDKAGYELRVGGEPMGEEEVTFTATGWKTRGRCDISGVLKAEYEAELDGGTWKARWKDQNREMHVESVLKDGKLKTKSHSQKKEFELDLAKEPNPFFYADFIWAHFAEIGRIAAASDVEKLTGLYWATRTFAFQVRRQPPHFWKKIPLRHLVVEVNQVEIHLLCSPRGLPVRIWVPVQQVDVVLRGFESVELPVAGPVSVVDSGEWRKTLSPPKHEVRIERQVRIPMRDGVKLAADLHRPAGDGRFPVLLARTPYGRAMEGATKGRSFASRGFVVVVQDVRGRGESEGEWFPLKNEERDGYDTIEWIAKQPWCDGSVGMIGASYVGWTQWYAAKSRHPNLKAIVPQVAPPDPTENIPYEGGVFLLATAWWAYQLEHMGGAMKWEEKLRTLPLADLDDAIGVKHKFLDEWLAHPPDDPYWDPLRYQKALGSIDLPAMHISGWYDGDQPGSVQNFEAMRKLGRKGQYLIMGPWSHGFNMSRTIGDVDFGKEAVIDLDSVILRFFDRYLKGIDNGIEREDPVAVFVMGRNTWRREKDWPLPSARPTKLHLAGARCHRRDGDGRLVLEPGEGPEAVLRYDPEDPPDVPVEWNDPTGASVTMDYSKTKDRDDVLDYTSAPLAAPVEVTGPVSVVLSVSTDAADTDFAASWYRLTKDGRLVPITGGVQRLRYRNGKDDPVRPGTVAEVTIDCWATGIRFDPGDRIRLEIGSTAYPAYARNLNTLDPPATAKKGVVATNRIHRGHLLLPVVGEGFRFE